MSASLQARHSRSCERGLTWTTFEEAKGCPCGPTYYVRARVDGKLASERIGKNRRDAERALARIVTKLDEASYSAPSQITFRQWALTGWEQQGERQTPWLESLTAKQSTIRSYRSTVHYAVKVIGGRKLRELNVGDVTAFPGSLDGRSSTTQAKHLRVLSACLSAAVAHGHLPANPVARLPKPQRPRASRPEVSHFTDEEITRLLPELEGVYRVLVETAVKTGARQGELLALTWGDVDLLEKTARIRRSWSDGLEDTPKSGKGRTVFLLGDLTDILGAWWGELGRPDGDVLVFPGTARGGHLDPTTVTSRVLYPAMQRAGIPREGESGRRRTFHSFRHTCARRALESGAAITWVKEQFGHGSITLTVDTYGRWETEARKKEAEKLQEAFSG